MSLAQIMYVISCMSPDTDPDTDLHCTIETLVLIKKIISKDSEGPGQTHRVGSHVVFAWIH